MHGTALPAPPEQSLAKGGLAKRCHLPQEGSKPHKPGTGSCLQKPPGAHSPRSLGNTLGALTLPATAGGSASHHPPPAHVPGTVACKRRVTCSALAAAEVGEAVPLFSQSSPSQEEAPPWCLGRRHWAAGSSARLSVQPYFPTHPHSASWQCCSICPGQSLPLRRIPAQQGQEGQSCLEVLYLLHPCAHTSPQGSHFCMPPPPPPGKPKNVDFRKVGKDL